MLDVQYENKSILLERKNNNAVIKNNTSLFRTDIFFKELKQHTLCIMVIVIQLIILYCTKDMYDIEAHTHTVF